MKKILFAAVAVVAISFASCGGNTQATEECDSCACGECACGETPCTCEAEAVEEVVEDTATVDSLVEEVVEEVVAE